MLWLATMAAMAHMRDNLVKPTDGGQDGKLPSVEDRGQELHILSCLSLGNESPASTIVRTGRQMMLLLYSVGSRRPARTKGQELNGSLHPFLGNGLYPAADV